MGEKALSYAVPLSLELAGIFILIIGIAVEISTYADIGYQLISIGSVLISVGSIIWGKIFRIRNETRGKTNEKERIDKNSDFGD